MKYQLSVWKPVPTVKGRYCVFSGRNGAPEAADRSWGAWAEEAEEGQGPDPGPAQHCHATGRCPKEPVLPWVTAGSPSTEPHIWRHTDRAVHVHTPLHGGCSGAALFKVWLRQGTTSTPAWGTPEWQGDHSAQARLLCSPEFMLLHLLPVASNNY